MPNGIKQFLDIKTTQSQVLTSVLQESLKILQLPTIDLASYIYQELEQNPLLSLEENDFGPESDDYKNEPIDQESREADQAELNQDNIASELYYDEPIQTKSKSNNQDHFVDYNELVSSCKSLKQHIIEQIYYEITDPLQHAIAIHLTDYLNDNGYFEGNLENISSNLGCSFEEIEASLNLLQKLEPTGVFARNLAECLLIQLKEQGKVTDIIEIILNNLAILAKGDLETLAKLCKTSKAEIISAVSLIKSLNPKPGSNFNLDITSYTIADVLVYNRHGKFIIELNQKNLPKPLVNRRYYAEIKQKTNSKPELKYLSEQYQRANLLIRALDQRANTILKVASEIVKYQHDFFINGIRYLKPLTLKTIADNLQMHESTISRVTSNKYISTPLGNFEMKYFFSSSLGGIENDSNNSSTTVKFIIKELISKEQPNKILSDEQIAETLKAQNINIARRTVAKYREAMNIPTSVIRKQEKQLELVD